MKCQILSYIVGGDVLDAPKNVELSPYGKTAEKYIAQLNDFYDDVKVDRYVIMPNHIHIMLFMFGNGSSRAPTPTNEMLPHIVSTFKRFCNKEIGNNIFQRGYIEHIIRDREDYETRTKYIYENPMRWYYDELYTEE